MNWRNELATLTAAGMAPRYPWGLWFDGTAHELVQGIDFMIEPKDFYNCAFKAAQRRGLRLRGKATAGGCTIVAFVREKPAVDQTLDQIADLVAEVA